jgi:acetyl-CoA acetyltransferase
MGMGPIKAVPKVLKQAGMKPKDTDLKSEACFAAGRNARAEHGPR